MQEEEKMRARLIGLAVLTLAACNPLQTKPAAEEWIPIANAPGGGEVMYKRETIVRDAAEGVADITAKITYPNPEIWTLDFPTYVEQKAVNAELVTLRFDCAAKRFALVRREALDADGEVKETIAPPVGGKETWRPVAPGGVAELTLPLACGR
jgi:hypothetical protein